MRLLSLLHMYVCSTLFYLISYEMHLIADMLDCIQCIQYLNLTLHVEKHNCYTRYSLLLIAYQRLFSISIKGYFHVFRIRRFGQTVFFLVLFFPTVGDRAGGVGRGAALLVDSQETGLDGPWFGRIDCLEIGLCQTRLGNNKIFVVYL